jgi:protein-S-isoprenylcysteine O-methyltransferase Ste14
LRDKAIDRRARCQTVDQSSDKTPDNVDTAEFDSRNVAQHFWCGLSEFNPRGPWGVDIKMWLYTAGAVQLQLNVLSCVAAHALRRSASSAAVAAALDSAGTAAPQLAANDTTVGAWVADADGSSTGGLQLPFGRGSISLAMATYAACLSFFVAEYMWHEVVHLWTYDIFRERIGCKLLFGCLAFYPFFYAVGILPLVHDTGATADISSAAAAGCVGLFFAGWALTRGANLQKFACKQGRRSFLWGLIQMETVPGSHGRLLCSGFWGSARHINYCGEILQAVALALPGWLVTGSLLPWLYPAYYVALFIPRQMDDDAICAAKYGPVWTEYCRRVPYRMVPGLW